MSMKSIPPQTLLLEKLGFTGVYLLFFAPKHRLWVLVRTASVRRFYRVPMIYDLSKNIKTFKIYLMNISFFTAEKNLCTLHVQVFVMKGKRLISLSHVSLF